MEDANMKIENLCSEQIIKDEDNNEMCEDMDNKMEIKNEIIKYEQSFPSELIIKDERYDEVFEETYSEYDKMLKETHSCDDCAQIFTTQEDFLQHQWIHKEKPFSCDVCDEAFTKLEYLVAHKGIHTGEKFDTFSCDDCGIRFGKRLGLIQHKRVHSEIKPYQCDFCDQAFTQRNSLFLHKQVHTEVEPWYNEEIPNEFSLNNDKMLKKISKTYSKHNKKIKRQNDLLQNERIQKEKSLVRDFCDKGIHIEEKFDAFTVPCVKRIGLIQHKRVHSKIKPYPSDVCNQAFIQQNSLFLHKRIHKEEILNESNLKNEEKTKAQNDLNQNERIHEEKSFVCDVCDEVFTKRQYLVRHKRIHIGEKSGTFSCDDCGVTFNKNVGLILHKRVHSVIKPCDLAFTQQNSLFLHKRIHTEVEPWNNEKIFNKFSSNNDKKLTKISKTYLKNDEKTKAQNNLFQNERIHEEKSFVCDVCDEVFTKRQYLVRHKPIHIGEKPGTFSCVDCGITFGKHVGLILHKRVHSVIKPFSCDVCNQAFTQQNSLFLHKRIHTEVGSRYNEEILNEFSLNKDKLHKKISKTYSKVIK